ncbi:MAG TPA: zinc-binding dehydrogenase [Gryllotalpicola sp.]
MTARALPVPAESTAATADSAAAAPRPARREVMPATAPVAMVWEGPGLPLRETAVPGVALAPDEALVALDYATVCGSDVHTVRGDRHADTPLVLGHEQVGRIIAAGEDARRADGTPLRLGDRVVWSVSVSCGTCDRCRRGIPQMCRRLLKYGHERMLRGWELNGGFATHVHLRSGTAIVSVPDALPNTVAAPAACSGATAVAALDAVAGVVPIEGNLVVVLGAGMVGLTAAAMAAERGATVVVTDPIPARRERALRFGAAAVADPFAAASAPTGIGAALEAAGAGREPVAVIEASGSAAAVRSALRVVATGGVVVLAGTVSPVGSVPLDPESVVRKLVTVRGVHNYAPRQLQEAVDTLSRLWLRHPFAELVSASYPLNRLGDALAHAARATEVRVGVDPRG